MSHTWVMKSMRDDCVVLFITLPEQLHQTAGFNLDFSIMNHVNGHDIVSPNGDNTHHHREPHVSRENITLWVNRLTRTDCIYNSPGAKTPSQGRVWILILNSTKRRTLTTQFMEFTLAMHYSPSRYRELEWRGCSTMAACTSAHKELHFNS